MTEKRKPPWLRISRDMILFIVGIFGILWETLAENVDRPTLLILFAGMVGLPVFLHSDETKKIRAAAEQLQQKPPAPGSGPGPVSGSGTPNAEAQPKLEEPT